MSILKSIYGLLCITFVMLTAVSCARQSETPTETVKETLSAADLIKQADEAYAKRENLEQARQAINLLKRARLAESKNYEAAWKLAQASYFIGKFSPDEKESEKSYKQGVETARATIKLAPDKPDGYFWTGANLGGQAQKSMLAGATSIGEVREMMNKVIEIQPDYQIGSAYVALAQVELATRLTGGKAEKALEYLEKAMAVNSENSYTRLYLAEANLALGRPAEAKKHLDFILKTKPDPTLAAEYNDALAQAKKLLETKF